MVGDGGRGEAGVGRKLISLKSPVPLISSDVLKEEMPLDCINLKVA